MSTTLINLYRHGDSFNVYNYIAKEREKEMYDFYNSSYLIVAATCEVAYGMMVDAKDVIRKTKLFKHQTKYHINKAMEQYKKMQKEMLRDMNCKPQFWLDYMDGYDELIKPLIDKLKLHFDNVMVRFKKESFGHEKALMVAAYNTLTIANVTFNSYFKNFVGRTGMNLSYLSPMKDIKDIKKEWELAIDWICFDNDFRLDAYKNCKKAVEKIYEFIEDPKSVNIPGEQALKLNPDCDVRIKVKDYE